MKNKGFIIFLTTIVTLLCLYYLSFTFISRGIQQDAIEFAMDENGNVDFARKQTYLDSVWNEPAYNFLGIEFTYKEVKETELSLGLDLQGGMHVTLEVSPVDIFKGLSGNSEDPKFLEALRMAQKKQRNSQEKFISLFYESWIEINPGSKLSSIFANSANRGRISFDSSDDQIIQILDAEVEDAIDRSFEILRTRIDRFGTSQPNIQKLQGTGRIQVELPGVENRERVRKLLQGVAKLEFWEVYELQEMSTTLTAINAKLMEQQEADLIDLSDLTERDISEEPSLQENQEEDEDLVSLLGDQDVQQVDTAAEELAAQIAGDSTTADSLSMPLSSPIFELRKAPYYGLFYTVKDTSRINRIFKRSEIKTLVPNNMKFLWKNSTIPGDGEEEVLEFFAIKVRRGSQAPLTGEVIVDARQDFDERGQPSVSMQMNATGSKIWRRLTAENLNRRIAVVLDNYVYSAPNVITEIPNGSSQITGNFTIEDAQDLANVLKAGKLPAPTRIVEEAVVGPTLGKEAQKEGVVSIISGLIIVVLFMVFYYSKGGLVANIALVFNIFFILGILAQLNASLTLPGIAGIVLTIGMSIDANVLIFERIREELRNGAGLKKAISTGYSKAYSSIIDANVTTFLTGVILYSFGQGPVRGFATTLMIGIASSFFSAVFITRVVVEWMSRKGDDSKLNFSAGWSKTWLTNLNIDFMSKRRRAYIFSAIFIVAGLVLIIIEGGLNLGVDFKGGRSYVVSFENPVVASDMKTALMTNFESSGTEVKSFGANNIVKITTSYMVDDESAEADSQVESRLVAGLAEYTGLTYEPDDSKVDETNFTISSSNKVGATIADDIKNASMQAVFFSLVVIFLYILVRFRKWQFGLGAVIALFHDTLFVLGAFAFARLFGKAFEIDQVFIAAMLTIIGYSINDTVVVFDRIRENMALKAGSEIYNVFNEAINKTISRTLITSFTTLIVVLILFIFGGEVLRGFSFALIIGILVGTYSSIFVATPTVLDLAKKKTIN
ncbi:protein translocase subunit SecDF [Bacteroidota bacterium]